VVARCVLVLGVVALAGCGDRTAADYPLTREQAYDYVDAGTLVDGHSPGGDVVVAESIVTGFERRASVEYVCHDARDRDDDCGYETRQQRVPAERTVYVVSRSGSATRRFASERRAFAHAAELGAGERWRVHEG
jgi:hypothetical protein